MKDERYNTYNVKPGKKRIQVTVSDEFYDLITECSKKIGVTNSQFCSIVLGQSLLGLDRAFKGLGDLDIKKFIIDK